MTVTSWRWRRRQGRVKGCRGEEGDGGGRRGRSGGEEGGIEEGGLSKGPESTPRPGLAVSVVSNKDDANVFQCFQLLHPAIIHTQ